MSTETALFLKQKGHESSHLIPKAIHQVPNLDHFQVIVSLAPEVKKAFPQRPRKVVFLDWSVTDPSKVTGSPEQISAAYEQTYQFIKTHINDLAEAILGT
jgi:protein-tyrosine-phosphatase